MRPTISVITVVKDDLAGLKSTADSIVSQNHYGFEWQIIDGFSTDGTWEYAQELKLHPFVTLSQTPPKGIYEAMNFGAGKSNAPWLWFINAGDVILADQIFKRIEEVIKLNLSCSIIASTVVYLTPTHHYFSLSIPEIINQGPNKYGIFHHQGCILNKTVFLQAGGFDESLKYAADGKLIDSMIAISAPTIVPIVAVGFEMGGATSKNFWRSLNEIRFYRHQILTMRLMTSYQIKETLRGLLLKVSKTSIGRYLLVPYLMRREESVISSAMVLGLEMPHKIRIVG
jgi:glycosyltransferase involved in cell wall biosynthesis